MSYKWELNASTGDYIARVDEDTRVVRMRGGGIYTAEFWGDYSFCFPLVSSCFSKPGLALKDLDDLKKLGICSDLECLKHKNYKWIDGKIILLD